MEENERQRQRARREMGEYFGDLLDERADGDGDDLVTLAATADDLERGGIGIWTAPHRGQHHDDEPRHERRVVFRRTRRDRRRSDGRSATAEAGDRRGASVPLPGAVDSSCRQRATSNSVAGPSRKGEFVAAAWMGSARTATPTCSTPENSVPERSPNRHIAFGKGIHYCLGAPLARVEADVALDALLSRFDAVAPTDAPKSPFRRNSSTDSKPSPVAWDTHRVTAVSRQTLGCLPSSLVSVACRRYSFSSESISSRLQS